ncbi:MAG: AAA family ATPase [Deltaproteobacteria bacterium]|jgi:predicted ATPase|nr:AAA family ATPase [Deltaproteobacteria bacterium]
MGRRKAPGRDRLRRDDLGFLRSVELVSEKIPDFSAYPFSIPALRGLEVLAFHPRVTFFVGENGSGKSTLLEAIAVALGFNAEGGSRNFNFATRRSESELHQYLRPVRGILRPNDGFFLRAESYFNVGTEIERLGIGPYGGVSVHEQSHGESFLRLANDRFRGDGLYLLDEPEAALSPARQLSFLAIIDRLVRQGSQLIIATHSPIILAYPQAQILHFGPEGIAPIAYEETEHYRLTLDFLRHRQLFLKQLLGEPEPGAEET